MKRNKKPRWVCENNKHPKWRSVCKHVLGFLDILSIIFSCELWKRSTFSEVPLNLRTKNSDWILRLKVLKFWFTILNIAWRVIVYYSNIFIAFVLFSPEYNWSENYHKDMEINYLIGFCMNTAAAFDVQKHFTGNMAPAQIRFVLYLIMDLLKCNYHKHDFHISASEGKKIKRKVFMVFNTVLTWELKQQNASMHLHLQFNDFRFTSKQTETKLLLL